MRPPGQELDYSGLLDLAPRLAEVAFGLEAPVEGADYPVLKSLNIYPNVVIDLGTP